MTGPQFNQLAKKCAKLLREANQSNQATPEQLVALIGSELSADEAQSILSLPVGRATPTGHEITNGYYVFQDVIVLHIETRRGGTRLGAGRKPTDAETGNKALVSVRVASDVAQLINAQPLGSRSSFVEAAVRAYAAQGA